MKNVYDMVTGEFINDELTFTSEKPELGYQEDLLQLQLVEVETAERDVLLPADLAYHIFFND